MKFTKKNLEFELSQLKDEYKYSFEIIEKIRQIINIKNSINYESFSYESYRINFEIVQKLCEELIQLSEIYSQKYRKPYIWKNFEINKVYNKN